MADSPGYSVSIGALVTTLVLVSALAFVAGHQLALGNGKGECRQRVRSCPQQPKPATAAEHWSNQEHQDTLWKLYGPYSRVVHTNWGTRTWVVPRERRAAAAAEKKRFLERFKETVTTSYLATVGDFEMEWALGLMAPANSTIVELGTCHGWGAVVIGTAMRAAGNNAKLWSVDLYDSGVSVRSGWCAGLSDFRKRMDEWGVSGHVSPKCCSSVDVAARIPSNSIDGIFIDANHSFSSVYEDLTTWWPKMKRDGVVLGHDGFTHADNRIVQEHLYLMTYFFETTVAGRDMLYHSVRNPAEVGSQAAEVSTAAMKFALPTLEVEFVCCVLNSSIWFYRRLPAQRSLVVDFADDGYKPRDDPHWPRWT
eukprot:TRINITY_DN14876_c0_g1_i2.p1 TRINITY_DN14876_c0_g1~~TRINITY_DN14876_c0_g1_i2.p1  ORF type:complete len:387 (+),score=93.62 TRINITY_DN14876_c0_g1_i2:64-1161(+)